MGGRYRIMAPDMNSVSDLFMKSQKHECLDHVIFLNSNMLEEYV